MAFTMKGSKFYGRGNQSITKKAPTKNLGSFIDGERATYEDTRKAEEEGENVTYTNREAFLRNKENKNSSDPEEALSYTNFENDIRKNNKNTKKTAAEIEAYNNDRRAQNILETRTDNIKGKGSKGLRDAEGYLLNNTGRENKAFEERNNKLKTKEATLVDGNKVNVTKGEIALEYGPDKNQTGDSSLGINTYDQLQKIKEEKRIAAILEARNK